MKVHYFNQDSADGDDFVLTVTIMRGYVPNTCLLGGITVMGLVNMGKDPCKGCNCDRTKCKGRPK
jgi:hypothetical protein